MAQPVAGSKSSGPSQLAWAAAIMNGYHRPLAKLGDGL